MKNERVCLHTISNRTKRAYVYVRVHTLFGSSLLNGLTVVLTRRSRERTERRRTNLISRVELSMRHDTRYYDNSRRAPISALLGREGLRLVEDGASIVGKGAAVVRAMFRARDRETRHYVRVYREHNPVLAAPRQSFEVMHPDSQGQAGLYRQLYVEMHRLSCGSIALRGDRSTTGVKAMDFLRIHRVNSKPPAS